MKPFAALDRNECRWPLDGGFCGCKTKHGRSYCPEHDVTAHRSARVFSDEESRRIADVITGVPERSRFRGGYSNAMPAVDQLDPGIGLCVGFRMESMSTRSKRR